MSPIQKKIEKFFVQLGMMITCLIIFVVVLETGFRLFDTLSPTVNSQQVNDSVHVPRPYVMAVASPNLPYINPLGYKGDLPSMPKPKNEIRIAVMGGSNTYGDDQSAKGSIPFKLEVELQKRFGRHIRVYNYGIPASMARQNLNRLVLDILPTKPDIVISYSGGNDFTNQEPRTGYPHRFIYYEVNPLWTINVDDYPFFPMMIFGSMTARHFYRNDLESYFLSKSRREGFGTPSLAWTNEKDLNYAHALISMDILAKAHGAQYLAFFQPMRDFYFGSKGDKRFSRSWINHVQAYIDEYRSELKFISLYNLYRNKPLSVWRDHSHLFPDQEELLIQTLANDIQKAFSDILKGHSKRSQI